MKNLLLILLMLTGFTAVQAQKFAYVDSEYILKNMPEYQFAKKQLDDIAIKWQKEIDEKLAQLDKERKDYEAEKVLMTEDMRIKKEEELKTKLKAIQDLQKKRFGKDGDMFKKTQELMKPIQDKVYAAIQEVSETKNYTLVLDKSGTTTIMYASGKLDISDQVIRQMGYEPGKMTDEKDDESGDGSSRTGGNGGIIDDIKNKAKDMLSQPPQKKDN
jgi:outer membrane protein